MSPSSGAAGAQARVPAGSEHQTAAALRASKAINHCQQVLTEESRLLLAAIVRDEMRVAIAEGISAAMTDAAAERFWSKGMEVLQRQAKEKAGDFLVDGVTTAAKRLLWVGVFALVVYSVGGWTLVKSVWSAVVKG